MFGIPELDQAKQRLEFQDDQIANILALIEVGWTLEEIKKLPYSVYIKLPEYYSHLRKKQETKNG